MKQPSCRARRTESIRALDEALTGFSQVAPRQATVFELRYFGGLNVRRDWDLAKAWLLRELSHRIE